MYDLLCTVELVQSDILWHPTKIYGPKVFLLTKIKPEYSDILYNPTHLFSPLVCQIKQVRLYIIYHICMHYKGFHFDSIAQNILLNYMIL